MTPVEAHASFDFANSLVDQSESSHAMSALVGRSLVQLVLCISQRLESRMHVRLIFYYFSRRRPTSLRLASRIGRQNEGKQRCRQDCRQY